MKLNPTPETIAIGQLQADIKVEQVAHAFYFHPKTIMNLIERYRQTESIVSFSSHKTRMRRNDVLRHLKGIFPAGKCCRFNYYRYSYPSVAV